MGGNPSQAWINGSFQLRVVGHEMGHNFGLYHSHSLSCDLAGCSASEYGDGRHGGFQKERLGWLDYGVSPPMVSVTNNDSAGCASSTFSLRASAPGWAAAFAVSTLTASPGASASTTLTVTSPTSAPEGFYTIGVTATNSAAPTSTASAAATYVVASSLAVTVTTDSASYSLNQWITITASVLLGQSPAPGASVTFTVMEPDGSSVTKTATTDTSGVAVSKLRVKRNDPTGTYVVQAHTSLDSAIFGDATASFDVP